MGVLAYESDNFIFRNIIEYNDIGIYSGNDAFENIVKNNHYGIQGGLCKIYRNLVTNNYIGISSLFSHTEIKYNNLLNNSFHATFYIPLFLYPFFQDSTKWKHNYYEGHGFGPKIIRGTLLIVIDLPWTPGIEIPWINIDWFAAKEQNDLDWLEGEIKSKIKI